MTPRFAWPLVALAALGCSSSQEVSSEPAAPRASSSARPRTPAASISPPEVPAERPRAPTKPRVRLVHLEIQGPEPRLRADALLRAIPTMQLCVDRAAGARPSAGWVVVQGTLATNGKLTALEVDAGAVVTEPSSCVGDAFRAVTAADPPAKDVPVALWISVSGPEPEGLDLLDPQEELLRSENGLCGGREGMDCKPKKMCPPPRERPVACPELHGLPPQPELKDADRRLDLGMSGGKTGQGSERVLLYAAKAQCAALKIKTDITGAAPKEERETVDIPCSVFERTLELAEARLLRRRPRGDEKAVHAVAKTVAYWKAGRDGVPVVTELQWAGPDPADEAFAQVASAAARSLAGRGALGLSRFVP